ncbi:electron transport complex subunit RsxD [Oleiphilus messinensis]|nr:electron transport complex subunit RsxD [Oleiphilus messinensis]
MAWINISSPHVTGPQSTSWIMQQVIIAALPGIAALTYFFGWGNLINIIWCSLIAIGAEALIMRLRQRPVGFYIKDYSALVTAILLGIALPQFTPWWTSMVAVLFAVIVAKHLYGGMGYNPFNPAMAGYALVLISFPLPMTTTWATPDGIAQAPSFIEHLAILFGSFSVENIDAFTAATPLDIYKHEISHATAEVVTQHASFGSLVAKGWEWVNFAFLLGGLYLILQKVITWHTPVALITSLTLMAFAFGWDADQATPPLLHLCAGATMLGAFFIATDPVSGPSSKLGKLWYGAGVGLLLYIIRAYGNYPDAIAFSVLLMNFAAPFIDYYTQPRTYGHGKANKGIAGKRR